MNYNHEELNALFRRIEQELGPSERSREHDLGGSAALVQALCKRGWQIATAESCTGGLAAHLITQVPGASQVFRLGTVVYCNQAKEQLLGVSAADLLEHGAVSSPVASQMVSGITRLAATATGLAITGIAGPGGGTPAKPVGLVYIATCVQGHIQVVEHHFKGGRLAIQFQAAWQALHSLRRHLAEAC